MFYTPLNTGVIMFDFDSIKYHEMRSYFRSEYKTDADWAFQSWLGEIEESKRKKRRLKWDRLKNLFLFQKAQQRVTA